MPLSSTPSLPPVVVVLPKPTKKEVIFTDGLGGIDSLGNVRGKPQVGDIVKVHCIGTYTANRPLFQLWGKKIAEKNRQREFLSTHIVGDTAFVNLPIRKHQSLEPVHTVLDILAGAARDMVLGESTIFTYDLTKMDESIKDIFLQRETTVNNNNNKWHRGHYGTIPSDALTVSFHLDVFRFSRSGEKQEFRRKNRNGTGGAKMMGSYSGGM